MVPVLVVVVAAVVVAVVVVIGGGFTRALGGGRKSLSLSLSLTLSLSFSSEAKCPTASKGNSSFESGRCELRLHSLASLYSQTHGDRALGRDRCTEGCVNV